MNMTEVINFLKTIVCNTVTIAEVYRNIPHLERLHKVHMNLITNRTLMEAGNRMFGRTASNILS